MGTMYRRNSSVQLNKCSPGRKIFIWFTMPMLSIPAREFGAICNIWFSSHCSNKIVLKLESNLKHFVALAQSIRCFWSQNIRLECQFITWELTYSNKIDEILHQMVGPMQRNFHWFFSMIFRIDVWKFPSNDPTHTSNCSWPFFTVDQFAVKSK